MTTLKLMACVDDQHQLSALMPSELPAGPVEIIDTLPGDDEDEAGAARAASIAHAWTDELNDSQEDIYTLDDGEPIDGRRCDLHGQFRRSHGYDVGTRRWPANS